MPIEESILEVGLRRAAEGESDFYGFALAEELGSRRRAGQLLGHGALYKALSRLERAGLLESRWEDVDPSAEGRPRRRLYSVTGGAAAALALSRDRRGAAKRVPRWASA